MKNREAHSWKITVPASTANLGAGFDSLGLALNLFLTIEVHEADDWQVVPLSSELEVFPRDETHYIVEVAKEVADTYSKKLSPCHLYVSSDIPLTRGLGSSAAAVIAGIELADAVGGLSLTKEEKLKLANQYEGHPDNVGASLYGGLVVSCHHEKEVSLLAFSDLPIEIVTVSPKSELKTSESRNVLPSSIEFKEAVRAGAVSNVLVAAFLTKDWDTAGKMMKQDRYHQPHRKKLLPHYDEVESVANRSGAFGVAISGAGPTIACFVEKQTSKWLYRQLQQAFPNMDIRKLTISNSGSSVTTQPKVRPSTL